MNRTRTGASPVPFWRIHPIAFVAAIAAAAALAWLQAYTAIGGSHHRYEYGALLGEGYDYSVGWPLKCGMVHDWRLFSTPRLTVNGYALTISDWYRLALNIAIGAAIILAVAALVQRACDRLKRE